MVIPAYNVLRRTLISIDSGGIGSIKEALLESLDSRFVSYCNSLPYCMATILNPRYKATFLNSGMIARAREALQHGNSEEDESFIVSSHEEVPPKRRFWDFLEEEEIEATNSIRDSGIDAYLKEKKIPRTSDP